MSQQSQGKSSQSQSNQGKQGQKSGQVQDKSQQAKAKKLQQANAKAAKPKPKTLMYVGIGVFVFIIICVVIYFATRKEKVTKPSSNSSESSESSSGASESSSSGVSDASSSGVSDASSSGVSESSSSGVSAASESSSGTESSLDMSEENPATSSSYEADPEDEDEDVETESEDLTEENFNYVNYAIENSDIFREFGLDKDALWNHWETTGQAEGKSASKMSDMSFEPMVGAKSCNSMPTNPGWQDLYNTNTDLMFTNQGYIWIYDMTSANDTPGDENLMSVPVDAIVIYKDISSELQKDVKIYVNVDDTAHMVIMSNSNIFTTEISGQGSDGVDVTLDPGDNRIMFVVKNTGGPAGLKVAMVDVVNGELITAGSTITPGNWKYWNHLYNVMGDPVVVEESDEEVKKLSLVNDNGDSIICNDGTCMFSYDYNNTKGEDIEAEIISSCDDFTAMWVDRKLINSKAIGDGTKFYCKFKPGKNKVTFNLWNYQGPGWLSVQAIDKDTSTTIFTTNEDWRYKRSGWFPGPRDFVTFYKNTNYGNRLGGNFWIGKYSRDLMESKGVANDDVDSFKVGKSLEVTLYKDDRSTPGGENVFGPAGYECPALSTRSHIDNNQVSMFVIKTKSLDRPKVFDHSWGGNEYRNSSKWTNTQSLLPGEYDIEDGKIAGYIENDKITSVYVPKGITLQVYVHGNFKTDGRKTIKGGESNDHVTEYGNGAYEASFGRLSDTYNDKVSSIKVSTNDEYNAYPVMNQHLL